MRGIGELRVESDRTFAMAGLAACGVGVEEELKGLIVAGTARANHRVAGGGLRTHGDHRRRRGRPISAWRGGRRGWTNRA